MQATENLISQTTGAQLLDGKVTAQRIREEVTQGTALLRERGVTVGLGVVLVGDDPASHVYVGMKERACRETGIVSISSRLPANATQEQVLSAVRELNERPDVHGILVQHPLPHGLDEDEVFATIAPHKDVDGVGAVSMGRLIADQPAFAACTAAGIIELLDAYNIEVKGRECVVVGRSLIVGKPAALLLLRKHGTVTICHSRTQDLAFHTRRADILIAAIGKAEFITGDMIKEGAVVVDAGYNRIEGRKGDVGDVQFESARERASFITPVPGGVGPMTIAMLMKQTLQAAQNSQK
ncbi:MAG: methylenetetrahydrofolate dehydrogenase / methenyltetrahydrofolate cyclohydrolase [Abditibacteriota bacterium]|nr:methylenetetrahydrofolate dehydrogenase / methenyltetrahydrofolate cyclohydrolase [Abditibacteriota bacterium]